MFESGLVEQNAATPCNHTRADVVGYSRLMEAAEEQTAARLQACQQLMSAAVVAADGRVFNRAGDAMLAEFASPINALRCAVRIREDLAAQGC